MDKIRKWLQDERVKGAVAIIAAVVMYYTPDHIDLVIETLLGAFGIRSFVIKNKEDV